MIRPDFKHYKGVGLNSLAHSAKGSTWEEHKYVKRIDGTYYYPDGYEGGRNISSLKGSEKDKDDDALSKLEDMSGMTRESLSELMDLGRNKGYDSSEFKELLDILSEGDSEQAKKMMSVLKQESNASISSNDIENLAREVIRGNFENGQVRKDLLAGNYDAVQKRVNELIKGSAGSTKISEVPNDVVEVGKKVLDKAVNALSASTSKTADIQKAFSVYNNHRAKR